MVYLIRSYGLPLSTSVCLQADVAVVDHVGEDQLSYFSFFLDEPLTALKIALTTLSGDPDLYVSTTQTRPSPGGCSC
jgi:hypothetical protein